MPGCPIRTPADQCSCAAPRGFSQLIASFFASESLGIPHTPLFCLSRRGPCPRHVRPHSFLVLIFHGAHFPLVVEGARTLSQYVNELSLPPRRSQKKGRPAEISVPPGHTAKGNGGGEYRGRTDGLPGLHRDALAPICQDPFQYVGPPSPYGVRERWWRISESNRWPPACKAGALAS